MKFRKAVYTSVPEHENESNPTIGTEEEFPKTQKTSDVPNSSQDSERFTMLEVNTISNPHISILSEKVSKHFVNNNVIIS